MIEVKNALAGLPESEEVLRADLELRVALFNAASGLQIKRLLAADLGQVKLHANTISLQGICLPFVHRLQITKRMAAVALSDNKLEEWQACVRLVPVFTDGEEQPWSVEKPSFGACNAGLGCTQARDGTGASS